MEKSTQFLLMAVAVTISISLSVFVYIMSQRYPPKICPRIEITVQDTVKKDKIDKNSNEVQSL